jgi:hypothetical protein
MGFDLDVEIPGDAGRAIEGEVDVFPRTELVLEIAGGSTLLRLDTAAGHRFIRADHVKARSGQLGEARRLPDGLTGRVRSISSNNYPRKKWHGAPVLDWRSNNFMLPPVPAINTMPGQARLSGKLGLRNPLKS